MNDKSAKPKKNKILDIKNSEQLIHLEYLKAVEITLEEWDSKEDEQAYGTL